MTAGERWAALNEAVDQAQGTLNRRQQHLARAARYLDECPDGDPRKAEAEVRVRRLLAAKNEAELAAGVAVDALLDFEDAHPGVAS